MTKEELDGIKGRDALCESEGNTAAQNMAWLSHLDRKALLKEVASAPSEDEWVLIQEILNAVGSLPGMFERMEAFLIGRGYDDAKAELESLRARAYGEGES